MNKAKLEFAQAVLYLCPYVTVDPRHQGAVLPGWMKEGHGAVKLQIGQDPNVLGMPDLVMDEQGWAGTLSFRGNLFHVTVPWEAVISIQAQGRGQVHSMHLFAPTPSTGTERPAQASPPSRAGRRVVNAPRAPERVLGDKPHREAGYGSSKIGRRERIAAAKHLRLVHSAQGTARPPEHSRGPGPFTPSDLPPVA